MNLTPCNRCDLGPWASIWSFSRQLYYHTPIKSKILLPFGYIFNPYPLFSLDFPILFHFTYIIFLPLWKLLLFLGYLHCCFCFLSVCHVMRKGALPCLTVSERSSAQHQCGFSALKRKQMVYPRLQISVSRGQAFLLVPALLCHLP